MELFLMKYEDQQVYGGPEEGGWWADMSWPQWKYGIPIPLPLFVREWICRKLNNREQNKEYQYGYTSVLSHLETFYSWGLEEQLIPSQPVKPHYE